MPERQLYSEIMKSGIWLYDNSVPTDVWIVKQNFEYWYEPDFSDELEKLNGDGEAFQVLFVRSGLITIGPSELSLAAATAAAEKVVTTPINWTNHIQQQLFGGRYYSLVPVE